MKMHKCSGTSLLEMSIAVLLLGMLVAVIGGILVMVFHDTLQSKSTQQLQDIELALRKFVVETGRLPCPAQPNLAITQANFGVEQCVAGEISKQLYGVVPVRTLGLGNAKAFSPADNRLIHYAVSTPLTYSYELYATATKGINLLLSNGQPVTQNLAYVLFASRNPRPIDLTLQQMQTIGKINAFAQDIHLQTTQPQSIIWSGRDLTTLRELQRETGISYCPEDSTTMPLAPEVTLPITWSLTPSSDWTKFTPAVANSKTNYVPCWQRYCTKHANWDAARQCSFSDKLPIVAPYVLHYNISDPQHLAELSCEYLTANTDLGEQGSLLCNHVTSGATILRETRHDQPIDYYRLGVGQRLDIGQDLHSPQTTIMVVALTNDMDLTPPYNGTLHINDNNGETLLLTPTGLTLLACLSEVDQVTPVQMPVAIEGVAIVVLRGEQLQLHMQANQYSWGLRCWENKPLWQPYRQLSFSTQSNHSKIYEVVAYQEALSDAQLAILLNYFKAKYLP